MEEVFDMASALDGEEERSEALAKFRATSTAKLHLANESLTNE